MILGIKLFCGNLGNTNCKILSYYEIEKNYGVVGLVYSLGIMFNFKRGVIIIFN